MATPSFKTFPEVAQAFGLRAFLSKSDPTRIVLSYVDGKTNQRRFMDLVRVKQTDGSIKWEWTEGKELTPSAEAEIAEVSVA